MFFFVCMRVCLCVLHICTVMQQKVVSAIYKLNYCEMLVKICFNFESLKASIVRMSLMFAIETQNFVKYAPFNA